MFMRGILATAIALCYACTAGEVISHGGDEPGEPDATPVPPEPEQEIIDTNPAAIFAAVSKLGSQLLGGRP